ncbi:hypothetical protein BV25DRAFT_1820010 [Artomyces pyxidatus]|uniref:Uncharacterized protein n=1 Tax=Artomyces pyxidatus TaxID=48021 RepID=A0ACB8TEQ2_9AGAM|nr:hypothetical protein BV25DRAFT_1820010 [Artomyces pyxidatus]
MAQRSYPTPSSGLPPVTDRGTFPSIGIAFHAHPTRKAISNVIWSLVVTNHRYQDGQAYIYTVTWNSRGTRAWTLHTRRGSVPDPAQVENWIGMVHIADVNMPLEQLLERIRPPLPQWDHPTNNSKWVLRTLDRTGSSTVWPN